MFNKYMALVLAGLCYHMGRSRNKPAIETTLETKNKAEFKTYLPGLHQLIPNLHCDIQEMLQEGNKVIVRCIVSGNPKGGFFGMQADGSKSFSIMTIDIHTAADNRIATIYHLEDWTAAFRQLKGLIK